MHALNASELLDAWERALDESPLEQALTLLELASPATPRAELARLQVGERDARLLDLRETAFGPQMTSLAACPACGERLELNFTVSDIRVPRDYAPTRSLAFELDGYAICFRPPNSEDLLAVANDKDASAARRA